MKAQMAVMVMRAIKNASDEAAALFRWRGRAATSDILTIWDELGQPEADDAEAVKAIAATAIKNWETMR